MRRPNKNRAAILKSSSAGRQVQPMSHRVRVTNICRKRQLIRHHKGKIRVKTHLLCFLRPTRVRHLGNKRQEGDLNSHRNQVLKTKRELGLFGSQSQKLHKINAINKIRGLLGFRQQIHKKKRKQKTKRYKKSKPLMHQKRRKFKSLRKKLRHKTIIQKIVWNKIRAVKKRPRNPKRE
jgi:hypothetical protein